MQTIKRIIMKQFVVRTLCIYLCTVSTAAHKITKRLIGGVDLPDHKLYKTQYVVALEQTFACSMEQFNHKLDDCVHYHVCGGSLINPDFVLTACHCLVFDVWYSEPPPIRANLTPGDIPPYIDDRINNKPRTKGDPIVYRKTVTVEHPLHNDMTIFAGSLNLRNASQKRHAAKFFVHHLCAENEAHKQPHLWEKGIYELDVGLVKACFPFNLNKDIQLAPLIPIDNMELHLHRLVDRAATCLMIGWGLSLLPPRKIIREGFRTIRPKILQHAFRYIQCNKECVDNDRHACLLCSTHHGSKLTASQKGDSGTPVICDGYPTAVHIMGLSAIGWIERNYTIALHVPFACVGDFISHGHLAYLRSLSDKTFHYINGEPVAGQ